MEPYGRRNKLKYNFVDNHIVGFDNWWEGEFNSVTKKRARYNTRREIKEELMSINVVDSEGSAIIKLDDKDSKKDVIIQDGKEISLSDAIKNVKKDDD